MCVFVCLLSHVWLFATPWAVAHQAPLSMGFCRQGHWGGFPDPGIKPHFVQLLHRQVDSLPLCHLSMWYLSFSASQVMHACTVWLSSFSMTSSVSIRVAANGIISIFFNGWIIFNFVCMCVYHIFFIYSSVDGHLDGLAVINTAALNIRIHVACWIMILRYRPRSGIARLLFPFCQPQILIDPLTSISNMVDFLGRLSSKLPTWFSLFWVLLTSHHLTICLGTRYTEDNVQDLFTFAALIPVSEHLNT